MNELINVISSFTMFEWLNSAIMVVATIFAGAMIPKFTQENKSNPTFSLTDGYILFLFGGIGGWASKAFLLVPLKELQSLAFSIILLAFLIGYILQKPINKIPKIVTVLIALTMVAILAMLAKM